MRVSPTAKKAAIPPPKRQTTGFRAGRVIPILVILAIAAGITSWPYIQPLLEGERDSEGAPALQPNVVQAPSSSAPATVAANSVVAEGYRGDVHPDLKGQTRLDLAADWTTIGKGRDKLDEMVPEQVYKLYRDAKPAKIRATYNERDFSGFLPEKIDHLGQVWSLDGHRVTSLLSQFHPNPQLHLAAKGRRAGPDGAFGVLKGLSPDYLDIAFRIHAEFDFTPKSWVRAPLKVTMWYTPANFIGRMIVNRRTGTVDYFKLEIPTEKSLNVHLTVYLDPYGEHHDIVRVDRMELAGGNSRLPDTIPWSESMEMAKAKGLLANQFYKFNDIDWVPAEQAQSVALSQRKPIMAMVLWGSLDDQSC